MSPVQPSWGALLWFVAVLALIPLALWLLRRTPLGSSLAGTTRQTVQGQPRSVSVLPLSAQHKVVTVEVGQGDDKQWLVLGLSPQGLQMLHTMKPGQPAPPAKVDAPQAAFAQLYSRLRSGQSGAEDKR